MYAATTEVSVDKSKAEIERILARYGAHEFISGWNGNVAMVGFKMQNRMLRFVLPIPTRESFKRSPTGKTRTEIQMRGAWEQTQRQRWRALALAIKAKLEAVECGIATFEQEFLANIMMGNGQTVYEWTMPLIEESYSTGKMPTLALPAPKKGS